jgi:hypothetical protein
VFFSCNSEFTDCSIVALSINLMWSCLSHTETPTHIQTNRVRVFNTIHKDEHM